VEVKTAVFFGGLLQALQLSITYRLLALPAQNCGTASGL
jgi:hypothetical protein